MKGFNKWRFMAGLILFFAGLDVALLLSHMSRLVGVFFLLSGLVLIITSRGEWIDRVIDLIPKRFKSVYSKKNLFLIHLISFVILFIISGILLYTIVFALLLIVVLMAISEFLVWYLDRYKRTKFIMLVTEFQLFLVLSTLVYVYFGDIFGYRDIPQVFPLLFLIGAWILEVCYLKSNIIPSEKQPLSVKEEVRGEPLANTLIYYLTFKGRLKRFIPLAGVAAIVGVLTFNMIVHGYLRLGSHDGITLLLGVCLLLYNHIPDKYSLERDFSLLFLLFLFLILVLPITFINYTQGPLTENTNSPIVYHLLARPTSGLLNLIGIESNARVSAERILVGLYVPVQNTSRYIYTEVSIGLSCTGLYSVTTFISAFLAFLMVHFSKFSFKLGAFMALGIFASWVANVLRMTLILVVRYHYGREAMLWTHHNAGIFIFMVWVAVFWGLMFKYFDIPIGGSS